MACVCRHMLATPRIVVEHAAQKLAALRWDSFQVPAPSNPCLGMRSVATSQTSMARMTENHGLNIGPPWRCVSAGHAVTLHRREKPRLQLHNCRSHSVCCEVHRLRGYDPPLKMRVAEPRDSIRQSYAAHIQTPVMGPSGGIIGVTVVLIYWTSPHAPELPAGALSNRGTRYRLRRTCVLSVPAADRAVPGDKTSSDRSPLGLRALPSRELARYR